MRTIAGTLGTLALVLGTFGISGDAQAYEYGLQFTPNPGGRNLVVAGYAFNGSTVIGNCSYVIVTSGSGRGGGYHSNTTYYNQTCTWDLYGNLLSMVSGAPAAPTPLASGNGLTVYARDAFGDTTGIDTTNGIGFVNTLSAQYLWTTPSGSYGFLTNQHPIHLSLTLQSVGDEPLVVTAIEPSALLARATLAATTCQGTPVPVGQSCTIMVTYNPSRIPRGDDPYTAYDTLSVNIVSNAGQAPTFSEHLEVPIAGN